MAVSDSDLAFILILLGAFGIYWEMHAPGLIIPGFFGVLMLASGVYEIYRGEPTWYGLALLIAAAALLAAEVKFHTHSISGLLGAVMLAVGAMALFPAPRGISPALALAAATAFGLISIFLGYLGLNSWRLGHFTRWYSLEQEEGVARTDLNPTGTIFVKGEYWQAVSDQAISAGERVCVESVDGMVAKVHQAP